MLFELGVLFSCSADTSDQHGSGVLPLKYNFTAQGGESLVTSRDEGCGDVA